MEYSYPSRKKLRLPTYHYSSSGSYFLTFCTKNKEPLLCSILGFDTLGVPIRKMTKAGTLTEQHLVQIPSHYENVCLNHWVVMPNHVHLLLTVSEDSGAPRSSRPTELVPRIIAALKRLTNKSSGESLWQSSYYDHVIRDEQDFLRCWEYIEHNPYRWEEDRYYV